MEPAILTRWTERRDARDGMQELATMLTPAPTIVAEPFTALPEALHFRGPPNEWVRAARPGQSLHSFLESCCFDPDGNLHLVDVPHGRIFRIDPGGAWTVLHAYDGEPHGLALEPSGALLVTDCRHGLLRLTLDGGPRMEPVCTRFNTERFRGLSDLVRSPGGDVWFTDPGRSSLSDPTGRVFRLRTGAAGSVAVPMLVNVPYPNGIALSPDGRLVYVAATRGNAVWRLMADAPDPTFPMAGIFLHLSGGLGPDGLAVDRHGNLAVVQAQAGRALVFDPMGDLLCRVTVRGGTWTTATGFGPDGRFLYIVDAQEGRVHRADLSAILPAGQGTAA